MSPASIIVLLIATWLLVAAAALWGMLRIARRHQRPAPPLLRPAVAGRLGRSANRASRAPQPSAGGLAASKMP